METEELCRIAEQDLDKTNRLIASQARHVFRFHSSFSIDPPELVDEYQRLLRGRIEKGYIVTSIESLAALDDTLVRLGKKLKDSLLELTRMGKDKTLQEMKNDRGLLPILMEITRTQMQRHWLMKIRAIIHSGQFVADEVDDIFDINHWVNEAIEEYSPPDPKIVRGIEHVFKTILGASDSVLAKALLNNDQANFTPSQLKVHLKALLELIYNQKTPFQVSEGEWSKFKQKITKETFVKYILADKTLGGMPAFDEKERRLRLHRHFEISCYWDFAQLCSAKRLT